MNSAQTGEQAMLASLQRLKTAVEGAIAWVVWDGRMVNLKDTEHTLGPAYNYQIAGFRIRDLDLPANPIPDPYHPKRHP